MAAAAANKAAELRCLSAAWGEPWSWGRGGGGSQGPVAWFNLIDGTRSSGAVVPVPSPEVALEGDTRSKFKLP